MFAKTVSNFFATHRPNILLERVQKSQKLFLISFFATHRLDVLRESAQRILRKTIKISETLSSHLTSFALGRRLFGKDPLKNPSVSAFSAFTPHWRSAQVSASRY